MFKYILYLGSNKNAISYIIQNCRNTNRLNYIFPWSLSFGFIYN